MQSTELQEKFFIHAHEVSHANWGTPNVVLHEVLIPFSSIQAQRDLTKRYLTRTYYYFAKQPSFCGITIHLFFLDLNDPGVGLATGTYL